MSAKLGYQSRYRVILMRHGVEINRGIFLAYSKAEAEQDGLFNLGSELFDETYSCTAEKLPAYEKFDA